MKIKAFPLYIGHCSRCNNRFIFIPNKINSVKDRSSDMSGIPRCPDCGRATTTNTIGRLVIDSYHIEER
jgi:hypothetical protein